MATLYFTKTFTKGMLKGISINEKMTFSDATSGASWLKKVRLNSRLNYQVTDYSFQNFSR